MNVTLLSTYVFISIKATMYKLHFKKPLNKARLLPRAPLQDEVIKQVLPYIKAPIIWLFALVMQTVLTNTSVVNLTPGTQNWNYN